MSREHTTFTIFRQSYVHLIENASLYAAYPAEQGMGVRDLFKYSPTSAALFAPLSLMPFTAALLCWHLLNAGAIVYAVTRLLPARRANLALLLLAPEVFVAVQSSSSNGLVAALIVLAAVAYERGQLVRGAAAALTGAALKIFPVAGLLFLLPERRRVRAALIAAGVAAAVVALPLVVVTPASLAQQYRWWFELQRADSGDLEFGLSLMRQMRLWWGVSWPNWPVQAAAVAAFLLPLALRRDEWDRPAFRRQYLCSLLVFVVIFNHQAERQSFVIAATGAALWLVSGPRTLERAVLMALGLIGVPTVPYLVLWIAMQVELLRGEPSLASVPPVWTHIERLEPATIRAGGFAAARRWSGSFRRAS